MYIPRNWEFGPAFSKLRNFGGGGGWTPPGTPVTLCVLKTWCGIYVLVCVVASVCVLRGFDVWSLYRLFLCCILYLRFLVCLFHATCNGVGTHRHGVTVSFTLTMDAVTSETCWANKLFKNVEYCVFSWIRMKRMLPRCTEPQTLSQLHVSASNSAIMKLYNIV
jgi:hypothetical protein